MANGAVETLWNGLWKSHARTKQLLTFSQLKSADQRGEKQAADQQDNLPKGSPNGGDDGGGDGPKRAYSKGQLVGLILGPFLFVMMMLFFTPEGLSFEARAVLASTLWIATWWISEAIPIPATSLLPIILLPVLGALDSDTVVSSYGDDIIFLFLGGFFIATAMEKWNLHQRMALAIIHMIGTSTNRIILGFMVATGFLSMWVSNTAAVMMMIPIGLAIVYQVSESLKGEEQQGELKKFEKAIIFGVGYGGTLGGLGTLIGTPPNIILAGQVEQLFGIEISFLDWLLFGAPIVFILIFAVWFYLTRLVYPIKLKSLPGGRELIQSERKALGTIRYEEKAVLAVFLFAAFMWITRTFIWEDILPIPGLNDGMVAIAATLLLFLIPASNGHGTKILEWEDSRDIPWGILLLFGGGLAIAAGFSETGLSNWIGEQLTILEGINFILIILVSTTLVMFLTEITSNTATGTMILPVVAALAVALEIHPFALMVPCAMAANNAFMLPVGTPPNAIIFGTGKLKIIEMVRNGFWLNVVSIILIVVAITFWLPILWDIDLTILPAGLE
ncbi:SLC13 family permease [Virgibacillus xinjiangensis]|uniref:Sodium-dependent dicarboxylate transporter SdcS n=1 Tax=Virgibacillus xinjiangensis TaxID=393090 RepID=A0ABV7CVK9_9BACI